MDLNFDAMKEAEKRHAEESQRAFDESMHAMKERQERENAEFQDLFQKAIEQNNERQRQQMEEEIQKEIEAAKKSIRAKYEQINPTEWNESDTRKGFRKLANDLMNDLMFD